MSLPMTIRVLGIDPGSQCTGFGVVDVTGPRLIYVASGTNTTSTITITGNAVNNSGKLIVG